MALALQSLAHGRSAVLPLGALLPPHPRGADDAGTPVPRPRSPLPRRFGDQPPHVMRRLRIANGLAEHGISPAQGGRADRPSHAEGREEADEPRQLRRLAHSCGLSQFIAAVRKRDPLPEMLGAQGRGVHEVCERDEQILDLAWRLLRWHPHERLSAAEALRHPALVVRERPYREGGTDTAQLAGTQLRYSAALDSDELRRLSRAICDGPATECTNLIAPAASAGRAARPPPEQERGISSWLSFDWRRLYKRAGERVAA